MKMRVCILVKPGEIVLQEREVPDVSGGEILVRVKAALTCGTDLKAFRRGHHVIPMPGVFGHEFSGVVEKTGRSVKGFRRGDEIMSVHSAPCLSCRYCKKKAYNLCEKIMDTKVLGAFAEYLVLPPHIVSQNVFHKPKSLSFEEAAFLEPLSCVVHSVESAGIRRKDSVLVIGAGPIGLLHLLLLKKKGVRVAVMDIHERKLQIAQSIGADTCMDSRVPRESDDAFTGGTGYDAVFECTGMPEVWEAAPGYSRKGGAVILFGGCRSGARVTFDAGVLHYHEITLRGVFHYTPSHVRKAYLLLSEGNLKVDNLISGTYSLEEVGKAFGALSRGEGIKYAIVP